MVTTTVTATPEQARAVADAAGALADALAHQPYPIPEQDAFVGTRGFLPAGDLEQIAAEWIKTRPRHFAFLEPYKICWLWKGKANKRGWTKPAKDLLGYFAEEIHFVIWLGADMLREEQFTHRQVRAQVFHELLHITQDDKGHVGVRADHDFEGFEAELEEFGPWTTELALASQALDAAPHVGMGPLFDALDDDEEDDTGV